MRTVTRVFTGAILAIALVASNPAAGLCQAAATAPLVRVDVSASIGAFGAHHDVQGDEPGTRNWSSSLFKGASIGYYWSDHLKTEIEASWPGPTDAYGSFFTALADGTQSSFSFEEHSFRTVVLSAAQMYQFGRNAFFHPFAGAGVDVIREHDTIERSISTSRGIVTTGIAEASAVHARGFVTAGFKAYVSERAFFRSEFKLEPGSQVEQMIWKGGFGVDF
jgi:hypothetical protein